MLNKKIILTGGSVMIIALLLWWLLPGTGKNDKELTITVKRAPFEITVFTTGELEAKNSVDINGPIGMRAAGIWQAKVADMIPEGKVVNKGDYVASLDKAELAGKLKEADGDLQKTESQHTQIKLDTTLTLRQARDEISNLEYQVKEKQIIVEQSAFEPPATVRQAKLDLEKSEKALQQARTNYKIKESQSKAKMQEISATLSQVADKLERLKQLMQEFTITAPESGMIIYDREWNGRRKTVGSTISAWDPTVAKLPDLSNMVSKTYVNEVDIRKLKTDLSVKISLDAFPEKKLTGKVVSVANVGEQNPKSDAKVFEVSIQINEKDTTLRPAMTTGNNIIVNTLADVLSIPLECIHTEGDSTTFVYVKDGSSIVRRQVITGESNENNILIKEGLKEEEVIFLSEPEGGKNKQIIRISPATGNK